MALKKGRIDTQWKDAEEENIHWYDTIDFSRLKTPPHIKKAKGWRFDFSCYENLHQKAITIQEKAPYNFSNCNDVYKDALYIGMYILERIYSNSTRFRAFDEILSNSITHDTESNLKSFARERFMKGFEEYSSGLISEESLLKVVKNISNALPESMKEWFEKDCEDTLKSDYEIKRVQGNVRQRKYREKVKEADDRNIRVL